jgi:hypothetical protein
VSKQVSGSTTLAAKLYQESLVNFTDCCAALPSDPGGLRMLLDLIHALSRIKRCNRPIELPGLSGLELKVPENASVAVPQLDPGWLGASDERLMI